MAIPTSNVSLRAAREDLSLPPEGGLRVTPAFRRFKNYDNSGPISLKGDLGGTCMGLQPYTGENPLSTGTAAWKNDARNGMRDQCYGNRQDSVSQLYAYSSSQYNHYSVGHSQQITVQHRNQYSNDVGYITRHWAYVPDGKSITLEYRIGKTTVDTGLSPKQQVEIVGYKDGWADGAQKMLGYTTSGRDYTDYVLGPFDCTGFNYVMITMNLFTGGRGDNMVRATFVPYGEIKAYIT